MSDWKEYKLGEVCARLSSGKGIKADLISNSGNYPVIGGNGIRGYSDICNFEGQAAIIGRQGAYCGNVRFYEGKAYMTEHAVVAVGNEYADTYYLSCYLSLMHLGNLSAQSAQPGISVQTLSKQIVRLPSKPEQQRIAAILKSLDDKIEVNRKINENLEQQAQALFKSWFIDFEPFKDGEFVESELGMIPQGWKVGDIYEYINVIYGAPYKSSLFNDKKEGLPLIRIRDLKTNAPQFYTPETLPNTEIVKAGDIVAGMDAEFIPYVWLGEHGVLNQRCCKFNGKDDEISNYYILFLIKPLLEYVQSYKTGTTVSHLGKADIDRFRFITPPLEIIKSFSRIVNNLLKEVVNKSKESRRLAELRDALLPRLMSGELKVQTMDLINEMLEKGIR